MGWRFVAVFCVVGILVGGSASADDLDVAVLSLRAVDGEDSVSSDLTNRLRANAMRVKDWRVQDAKISLEQMMLAHGCSEPKASCLKDIADNLQADRIISGSVKRVRGSKKPTFRATVFFFNARTKQIAQQGRLKIVKSKADEEYMETLARRFISRFGDDKSVLENPPTPAQPLELKDHKNGLKPGIKDDKGMHWWPAATAFGSAGVFLGLTAWNWATIRNVENDSAFEDARRAAGPTVGNVCTADQDFGVSSLCSKADKHEKMQYVFLGLGVVSAGIGTWLLVKHRKGKSRSEHVKFQLSPSATKKGGGVRARLEF